MSSVIGASTMKAMATRPACVAADNTYQPDGASEYDDSSADIRSRCGSSSETPRPSAAMINSKHPYARSSEPRRAAYRMSAQMPDT